jgi:hypothetical protein
VIGVIKLLICKKIAQNMYNIKYINAHQAETIHFMDTKKKLLKKNAALWFNKICRTHQLMPKYINIKVNGNNKQSKIQKTQPLNINQTRN